MGLLDGVQEQLLRYRNRTFLKAAMAASALTAYADGRVTLSERYRIDDIVSTLEQLRVYDPRKAAQILDEFLYALRDAPEEARRVLIGKLERIAADREAAELIVRIALSVCKSDGAVVSAERAQFAEICDVLGFKVEDFDLDDAEPQS